jgi:uncharacterized protein (UPF0332 family)
MNPIPKTEYVKHRLERAKETLAEAHMLFDGNHLSGAVNRIYYSMFYAVSALALSRDFTTSSHAQLRGYFNREFVKTGIISVDLGKTYNLAFENRTKGDYTDFTSFEQEEIFIMLENADNFIDAITNLIAPQIPNDQEESDHLDPQ